MSPQAADERTHDSDDNTDKVPSAREVKPLAAPPTYPNNLYPPYGLVSDKQLTIN